MIVFELKFAMPKGFKISLKTYTLNVFLVRINALIKSTKQPISLFILFR